MEQDSYGSDAWAGAVLGTAIGVLVDRTINGAQVLDNGPTYGMVDGKVYTLGQPSPSTVYTATGVPAATTAGRINPLFLVIALGAFMAFRHKG